MKSLVALATLVALPLALPLALANAQDPAARGRIELAQAKLAPISGIVGTWEGDASTMIGPGATRRIRQSEDIVRGASGTVIFIRGTGRSTETADAGAIVFEAAAIIWYDGEQDRVRMVTHRDGQSVEPEIEIKQDTITWGFPVPGGSVRYVITLTEDTWTEVGHFIREGVAPVQVIEMKLRRTGR